jgi:two-component system response regulator PilR (NtrC family)
VDVRILAASNRDLEKQVKLGLFREDLFYRLNVIRVYIPPLRERKEDIPILARHFLDKYNQELNKPIKKISEEAEQIFLAYNWPGNVRELENAIERAVSLEKADVILPESLPDKIRFPQSALKSVSELELPSQGIDLEKTIEEIERKIIKEALIRSKGVKVKAAELLGLSFRSFRYRVSKLGIDPGDDDAEPGAEEPSDT